MADTKQVQLNGAYYGPPIPPRNTYEASGRRRGSCGCCCLLTTLLKFVISVAIIAGILLGLFWLIFRPNRVNIHVESASLTQFNLTNSNSLTYNFTMDISIRNPNRRIGFYYDDVEARAYYDGYRFSYDPLPSFYQGHKNTTVVHPAFQGQALALGSVTDTFDREKGEGNFYVKVKLHTKLRLRLKIFRSFRFGHFKPKIDCVVKLPVPSSNGLSSSFERTKCDSHIF